MQVYRPSGESDSGALPAILLGALAGGIVAGAVLHLIGEWIRLLLIFALLMGLVAGGVAAVTVERRKVRAPLLAGLLASLGGLAGWLTDMGIAYARQRAELREELRAEAAGAGEQNISDAALSRAVDEAYVTWAGGGELSRARVIATVRGEPVEAGEDRVEPAPGRSIPEVALAWLHVRAAAGTTITRGSGKGTELGSTGTFVLWGVELLTAALTAFFMAFSTANEPFCETCKRWFPKAPMAFVGLGGKDHEKPAREALLADDTSRLTSLIPETMPADKLTILELRRCESCDARLARLLRVRRTKKKEEQKLLVQGLLPAGVADALLVRTEKARTS